MKAVSRKAASRTGASKASSHCSSQRLPAFEAAFLALSLLFACVLRSRPHGKLRGLPRGRVPRRQAATAARNSGLPSRQPFSVVLWLLFACVLRSRPHGKLRGLVRGRCIEDKQPLQLSIHGCKSASKANSHYSSQWLVAIDAAFIDCSPCLFACAAFSSVGPVPGGVLLVGFFLYWFFTV